VKHPVHMEAPMATGHHSRRGHVWVLALLVVLSLIMAVAAGACGGKQKSPGGSGPTLHPSATPSTSSGSPGSPPPSKGPSSTITPTSSASPTGKPPSDAAIRAGILRRLSQEPSLVGIQFTVNVVHAVVHIFGSVKTQDQLTTAEKIALSEPGIKKVISYLKVRGQTGY